MRKIFCILMIACSLFFFENKLLANHNELETPLEFRILNKNINTSIHEDSARISFKFKNFQSLPMNFISIGMNTSSQDIKLNDEANFTTTIKKGKYKFYFYIPSYEEVITDSIIINSQENLECLVNFYYEQIMITPAKPVIYFYPEIEKEISVQLNVKGELGFTYPVYKKGWNFKASPNGNLKLKDGKTYNYLFWESEMAMKELKIAKIEGFLVATDTLLSFLEKNLDLMGFNSKESADFITYWYPRMIKNEINQIQFLFNEACDSYAELKITPSPNHIFRVGMLWSKGDSKIIPDKQIIPKINREGFSVLEWGGIEMEYIFEKEN